MKISTSHRRYSFGSSSRKRRASAYRRVARAEILESRTLLAATFVSDINATTPSSLPYGFTDVNGTIYFGTNPSGNTHELWKSDGTSAGTAKVPITFLRPDANNVTQLTSLNGLLY